MDHLETSSVKKRSYYSQILYSVSEGLKLNITNKQINHIIDVSKVEKILEEQEIKELRIKYSR